MDFGSFLMVFRWFLTVPRSCGRPFTLLRRRHHCRGCGRIFCDACSPLRGAPVPQRRCQSCWVKKRPEAPVEARLAIS